ncbi:MAG: glycosyltransferase family 39 protein [Nitrososphaerota archaeon]|nr:glycosyltransferase family 39 protein [Nitrososphaerota archaeon]MDG6903231.1 glycosyltransferase family 39 protein [Nitrososphaerota archaeon]MDG6911709.1 glycosyltransferase family 39 protein [Nitrososphaerota archaeon]MDG6940611.1 glycosyltransferase family 39 protein [Nitrososphaerota archaeon]MDG6960921.1 glycosyltransferase family 39 protein [Nitrososphaerota archaeon]
MGAFDTLRSSIKRPTLSRRSVMLTMALAIVFSIAVLMRSYAAKYGFYLNEFDPYYDYYAAQHIVNLAHEEGLYAAFFANPAGCGPTVLTSCHNLQGYFFWHDIQTWFPVGRNVAATSQDGLQIAGAMIYLLVHDIFGVPITLYDLLIVLPVLFGALTSVLFYFVVKKIAGDAAGLFAALVFAVSPPLIERGNLGWFKSEPLTILLFVAASYMLLTAFDKGRPARGRVLRALAGGIMMGYGNTAWGGGNYFTAAFGVVFLILPFLNMDLTGYSPAIVTFASATLFMSAVFPFPGVHLITDPIGLAMIGGTVFFLISQWVKTWAKPTEFRPTLFKLLFGFGLGGLALLSFGLVGGLSLRYLTVLYPGIVATGTTASDELVKSVAEQVVPTGADYFTSYAILMSFGIVGALVAFKRKGIPMIYALVFGLTGLYFSASFSRLLVYSSLALGILGGIGFAELAFALVKPSTTALVKKKQVPTSRNEMKVVFSIAVIALLVLPAGTYWIPNPVQCTSSGQLFCDNSPADSGVSITNGATIYSRVGFPDWIDTLQWMRQNTPTNSVIIAWWDYGYWITVMGNRTTLIDNATINSSRIAQVGRLLMSNATQAAAMAQSMTDGRPTYVAIFVTGSIMPVSSSTTGTSYYYILQVPSGGGFTPGGGDESKKQWFIRIGGLNESNYLECPTAGAAPCTGVDDFNLTPYGAENSLFGQFLPFRYTGWLVPSSSNTGTVCASLFYCSFSTTYQQASNGAPPYQAFAYPGTLTYPSNSTGPFRLAYISPSFSLAQQGISGTSAGNPCPGDTSLQCFNTILVYQLVPGNYTA